MIKKTLLLFFLNYSLLVFGQQKDNLSIKNGIENPSLLTTHHFGIFSSRINQNYKINPPKSTVIAFTSVSGNNFHPFVETYLPKDPQVRENLS